MVNQNQTMGQGKPTVLSKSWQMATEQARCHACFFNGTQPSLSIFPSPMALSHHKGRDYLTTESTLFTLDISGSLLILVHQARTMWIFLPIRHICLPENCHSVILHSRHKQKKKVAACFSQGRSWCCCV